MKTNSYVADKRRILTRLRPIEGQARGLAKMVAEDRYCIDVLQQIASLRAAADGVALILLRDHLDGCLRQAYGSRLRARKDRRGGGSCPTI